MSVDGILIQIGDFKWFIHQTIVIWLVIGILVTVLLCWGGSKLKNADPSKAPKGAVLVFEVIGNTIKGILGNNLHDKTWNYLPIMGTLMLMMVISNLMGLLGLQAPTSNLSVDISLVAIMICMIHGTDIKLHGFKGKFKSWCEPIAPLLPLNIIGDIAFPISLTLRLFGNMLGGTIIVLLLYTFISAILPFGVLMYAATPFLHMYFDIFTACMQTYIFFTLASFFLGEGADVDENSDVIE